MAQVLKMRAFICFGVMESRVITAVNRLSKAEPVVRPVTPVQTASQNKIKLFLKNADP